jgi:hypothetical protein
MSSALILSLILCIYYKYSGRNSSFCMRFFIVMDPCCFSVVTFPCYLGVELINDLYFLALFVSHGIIVFTVTNM